MRKVKKNLTALLLALVMALTLLPVQAMAAERGTETASDGALLDGYLYQLAGMDIADYESALSLEAPECRELFDAVMALDKRYRVPVLLYYYEGYSQKEIAEMLAVPEETVRTRLFRARGKLKTSLTEVLQYD